MGNPQWHVLQVRRRFERIIVSRVGECAVDAYLPLRRIDRPANTHSIEVPLFPGYVFCKCDAVRVRSLWRLPGVLAIVRGTDGIHVIPEQQIADVRRILASGWRVQPCQFIERGRTVTVEDGPLSGVTGILEERADKRLLVLSIELISRSIAVKIDHLSRISFRPGVVFPIRNRLYDTLYQRYCTKRSA